MKAEDSDGNRYQLGSHKIASHLTSDNSHTAYLLINETLAGWIDLEDQIRNESFEVISFLHSKKIETIFNSVKQ